MQTFAEYMSSKPLPRRFDQIMELAEEAAKQGKYHFAWDWAKSAIPENEEDASYQAHFLDSLRDHREDVMLPKKTTH